MASKRRRHKQGPSKPAGRKPPRDKRPAPRPATEGGSTVRARKLAGGNDWQLVHPRCARDRQLDIEEVRKMLAAGEVDVALDECRWLLTGCTDCIDVHRLLGEIAMAHGDLPLARGHFGYAYRLGAQALQRAGSSGPLPYRLPANQGFLESAKGLAWCLKQLGKPEMAAEVIELALQCDPNDPLAIKGMLADGSSGGAPSLPVID